MSNEHSRRSSTTAFVSGDSVPRAPPLPALKPLQRAREAATRLFGYSSRPPSPQGEGRISYGGGARFAPLSATQNASTSHKTGLEINTISINEAGTHALLGGKEIFKTVKVAEGTCAEEFNLRSAIRSTPTQASGQARQVYSVNIADVAWAKGDCGDYVAAATSSGKIILYDLGHAGLQAAQLHDHFRQVHKVTFNPHRGSLLLSGSQDGTVRLWDVRDVKHATTLKSKHKYSGQADGIRDVKWSPTEGVDFAFGTDSGWIQRWDMRNLKTAKVKIAAHGVTCNTIDWHPDGKYIASASADQTVSVWDFSTTRKQKPSWQIRTPHPVVNARWRPSCDSPMSYESGTRQCTQLVTAYSASHPVLHVWDFRRPSLPFREVLPYPSAPTDLLWHSQDLLWTVGREGVFLQTDIQYATKPISKRNLQAVSASPLNEISFVSQRRRRQRQSVQHDTASLQHRSSSLSVSPERSALSRSWADDGLDHSFLSVPPAKRNRASVSKSRTHSFSMAIGNNESHSQSSTAHLSEVLSTNHSTRPIQAACRGFLDRRVDVSAFEYLAVHLRFDLRRNLTWAELPAEFEAPMQSNIAFLEASGMYRLAQSWRIVEVVVTDHLKERLKVKQHKLLRKQHDKADTETNSAFHRIADELLHVTDQVHSSATSPTVGKPESSIAQQLAVPDSASNQLTPQAQPQREVRPAALLGVPSIFPTDQIDQFALPPLLGSVEPAPDSSANGQSSADPQLTRRNLHGLLEQQHGEKMNRSDMVQRWSAQPKEPLSLDPVDANGIWIPPKLQKHDSNESFAFLAESSDSRGPSFPSSFNSNDSRSGPLRMVAERPSKSEIRKHHDVSGIDTLDFGAKSEAVTAQVAAEPQHISRRVGLFAHSRDGYITSDVGCHYVDSSRTSPVNDVGPGSYPDENGISPLVPNQPFKAPGRQLKLENVEFKLPAQPMNKPSRLKDGRSILSPGNVPNHNFRNSSMKFLPEDDDTDTELGKPFTLKDMVQEMTINHALKGNAQIASALYLLLGPLLPRTHPLPESETVATVSAYGDCLSDAGFAHDGVETIFTNYIRATTSSGLQPLQIEAVLEAYHEQLLRHRLLNEAGALRKLSYPMYPAVYDQAIKDNCIHLLCGNCGKSIVDGMSDLRCESCGVNQASCPVCWCNSTPFVINSSLSAHLEHVLMTCILCNHSGHAACLQLWFRDSDTNDGGCPTSGCLCDCTAGSWRAQKAAMAERKRRSRGHARVKSDDWPVQESNAVERTRTILESKSVRGHRSDVST